jgi:hypothetical protein
MALNFLVNNNFLFEPVGPVIPVVTASVYEPRAVFSISASNDLQGTFWITKDGQQVTSSLGSLSFVIRDQDGVTVGITESGLVADVNGFFYMTPVLADAIQDLTHYTVEMTCLIDSQVRKGVVAITLGE